MRKASGDASDRRKEPSLPTTHATVRHQSGRPAGRQHARQMLPVQPDDLDVTIVRHKDDLIPLKSIGRRLRGWRRRHVSRMSAAWAVGIALCVRRRCLSIGVTSHTWSVLIGGVYVRWRCVGKETTYIVPRHDLHQVASLDVPDLDKGRLERQYEGIVHGCE